MLRRLSLFVLAAVFALSVGVVKPGSAEAQSYQYRAELNAAVNYYFYGYERWEARAILRCESGFGADVYNDYSGAAGPWQFMPATAWGLGYSTWDVYDPWLATQAAEQLHETEGWSPWACAY